MHACSRPKPQALKSKVETEFKAINQTLEELVQNGTNTRGQPKYLPKMMAKAMRKSQYDLKSSRTAQMAPQTIAFEDPNDASNSDSFSSSKKHLFA